jgi:hypothetical protein
MAKGFKKRLPLLGQLHTLPGAGGKVNDRICVQVESEDPKGL